MLGNILLSCLLCSKRYYLKLLLRATLLYIRVIGPGTSVYLIFDGLDTFADVYVCNQNVATTANQFCQYVVNITPAISKCAYGSKLRVVFTSPRVEAKSQATQKSCSTCIAINQQLHEFPDIHYVRKQQLDFGWDFAPAYSPIGICKSVKAVVLDPRSNVRAEAEYQVRRLNHHPSLAVWSGNNELEHAGLRATGYLYKSLLPATKAAYEDIFLDTLVHAVFDNTRSISYLPTSVTYGYVGFNKSSNRPFVQRYDPVPGKLVTIRSLWDNTQ